VGSYPANTFGLYDMHGSLLEWCNDWWGAYGGAVTNPVAPEAGVIRVIRGGSWGTFASDCRSAVRGDYGAGPSHVGSGFGLRPVRSAN
jgi:formylglycine-generating enzyme required for sulfatase activity